MSRYVAIYCGANPGYDPLIVEGVKKMAAKLASKGWNLIYGGGKVGLMGITADTFLENKAQVIGVIPDFMVPKELAHTGASEMIVVGSMHERKTVMTDRSHAAIILPGGFGTMDELFETLTWMQLRLISKPIIVYNLRGFYDDLIRMVDNMVSKGYLKPANRELLRVVHDIPHLLIELERNPPEAVDKWYDKI